MDIRTASLNFPRSSGSGPRQAEQAVIFPREVDNAVVALTGYSAGFVGGDHHLGRMQVELDAEINANVVIVRATFGVRDWSGDWDDDYAGTINATVLAELVDISLPPARGDLQITGVEVSQAIQSFRSAQHLDAAHVLPDNAITLIGGKTTGLRVYVDFMADAALPPIAVLSGQVEVTTGGNTVTIFPVAGIVPRRDSEISRSERSHTLNFSIPEDLCRGSVDVRIRVFDSADHTQSSAALHRTLQFIDVNPLRVFGVGIHYTGQGMDLAAPDPGTVLSTFDYARRTFPTGDVQLSGYDELGFSDDMVTTDTSGCGDGFESLNGKLKDLRGDSDDLFYGLLPTGVNYGTFVGCGGDGVGSGAVGDTVTAAHEAGHAYGRKHAPCDDSGRCDDPSNQDSDYPQYALFDSDSIGEFGYDPENDRVFSPANSHDFMGYSGMRWVSPYTYSKLLVGGDPIFSDGAARVTNAAMKVAGVPRGTARSEWMRRPISMMQIDLHVAEDRKISMDHIFTFPAVPRLRRTRPTKFSVETRDDQNRVRAHSTLQQECFMCGPEVWPRHLIGELPIDFRRARRLVIREGAAEIASFDLPDPPKLSLDAVEYTDDGRAILRWNAESEKGLAYLVHWQDEIGTWRGFAPRQSTREFIIPERFRLGRRALPVRVLASNGLVTSIASTVIDPREKPIDPDEDAPVRIVVLATDGPIKHAVAIDHLGRTLSQPDLRWFDERGGEIARGASLDTRQIPGGKRIVRVVAINAGAGKAEADVAIVGLKPSPQRGAGRPPKESERVSGIAKPFTRRKQ